MSAFAENKDRNVIPRWRDSSTTAQIRELDSFRVSHRPPLPEELLAEKVIDWERNRTVPFAAELTEAALVLGFVERAKGAAQFLLNQGDKVSVPARTLAARALGVALPLGSLDVVDSDGSEDLGQEIGVLRLRLRDEPRNALAWADMARRYAALGMSDKALRAMRNGVALAPTNRFILRSAARLHIHRNDPEYAHSLLSCSSSTPYDPWLVSAEIAVGLAADRWWCPLSDGNSLKGALGLGFTYHG